MHFSHLSGLGCLPFYGGASFVVDSLFYISPIVCVDHVFGLSFIMQYLSVLSSFSIILVGKRELVAFFHCLPYVVICWSAVYECIT